MAEAIRRISPAVFGVYLIHEHVDVSSRWAMWIVGDVSEHFWGYLIQMTESVLLVFWYRSASTCCGPGCLILWEGLFRAQGWEGV